MSIMSCYQSYQLMVRALGSISRYLVVIKRLSMIKLSSQPLSRHEHEHELLSLRYVALSYQGSPYQKLSKINLRLFKVSYLRYQPLSQTMF